MRALCSVVCVVIINFGVSFCKYHPTRTHAAVSPQVHDRPRRSIVFNSTIFDYGLPASPVDDAEPPGA
uniref:Putative secreted protein n=1 Tax=Anopheles triannulatus TaxID=58253 RepID=A0A2M4B430_9DIPT